MFITAMDSFFFEIFLFVILVLLLYYSTLISLNTQRKNKVKFLLLSVVAFILFLLVEGWFLGIYSGFIKSYCWAILSSSSLLIKKLIQSFQHFCILLNILFQIQVALIHIWLQEFSLQLFLWEFMLSWYFSKFLEMIYAGALIELQYFLIFLEMVYVGVLIELQYFLNSLEMIYVGALIELQYFLNFLEAVYVGALIELQDFLNSLETIYAEALIELQYFLLFLEVAYVGVLIGLWYFLKFLEMIYVGALIGLQYFLDSLKMIYAGALIELQYFLNSLEAVYVGALIELQYFLNSLEMVYVGALIELQYFLIFLDMFYVGALWYLSETELVKFLIEAVEFLIEAVELQIWYLKKYKIFLWFCQLVNILYCKLCFVLIIFKLVLESSLLFVIDFYPKAVIFFKESWDNCWDNYTQVCRAEAEAIHAVYRWYWALMKFGWFFFIYLCWGLVEFGKQCWFDLIHWCWFLIWFGKQCWFYLIHWCWFLIWFGKQCWFNLIHWCWFLIWFGKQCWFELIRWCWFLVWFGKQYWLELIRWCWVLIGFGKQCWLDLCWVLEQHYAALLYLFLKGLELLQYFNNNYLCVWLNTVCKLLSLLNNWLTHLVYSLVDNFPYFGKSTSFYYEPAVSVYTHNKLFQTNANSTYTKGLICLFMLVYYLFLYNYFKIVNGSNNTISNRAVKYEYPILVGFLWLGYSVVISSSNLFVAYLGFELQTFIFLTILVQFRESFLTILSSLQYFFLTFLSSLFFLVSIFNFLYVGGGTLNYTELGLFLSYSQTGFQFLLFNWALLCLLFSFLFKFGLFPFYLWVLSIFEGIPALIFLLLITLNKFNLFIFLIKLLTPWSFVCYKTSTLLSHIFSIIGFFSLVYGAFSIFTQVNLQRFFAATSIIHFSFLIFLFKGYLVSFQQTLLNLIYSYFILYFSLTFLFFSFYLLCENYLTNRVEKRLHKFLNFKDFSIVGVYSKKILISFGLILVIFSGFPPFSFFFIKLNSFIFLCSCCSYLDCFLLVFLNAIVTGGYLRFAVCWIIEASTTAYSSTNLPIYFYFQQFFAGLANNTKNKLEILVFEVALLILGLGLGLYNYSAVIF